MYTPSSFAFDDQTEQFELIRQYPFATMVVKSDGGLIAMMAGQIIGLDIATTQVEGKKKLSQNRPIVDQHGVVAGLRNPEGPFSSHSSLEVATLIESRLKGTDS